MAYRFLLPGKTAIGENALALCEADIRRMGKKALIVTGKNVSKTEALKKLDALLEAWGIERRVFTGITGEPTLSMIREGVEVFLRERCDFLIGLGGGSPLDSVKAIAAMSCLDGEISDYMGRQIAGDFAPMVLIPTTAGTGSEATKFTIVTDTQRDVKMLLAGEDLLPDLAVVDYTLTLSAPKSVTAATGMDALTHAVEAYTSKKANPLTDLYALNAIRLIFENLPTAYRDGGNAQAREKMALAAYEAGVCINNSSVTLVHGMSRPIGALFHVAHGISNAMLIGKCLKFAVEGCYDRFATIARTIGAADAAMGDKEAAEAFIDALEELCDKLEIPTLEQYGIERQAFFRVIDKMAGDALGSGSPANTRRQVSREDMADIYRSLWDA